MGARLGPVIGGLATWGLELLTGTAPGSDEKQQRVFDRTWTSDAATQEPHESYQWSIDGAAFELAVRGDKIIRTPGPGRSPRRDAHREQPDAGQPRHRQAIGRRGHRARSHSPQGLEDSDTAHVRRDRLSADPARILIIVVARPMPRGRIRKGAPVTERDDH
jgi:hypothetical protein